MTRAGKPVSEPILALSIELVEQVGTTMRRLLTMRPARQRQTTYPSRRFIMLRKGVEFYVDVIVYPCDHGPDALPPGTVKVADEPQEKMDD